MCTQSCVLASLTFTVSGSQREYFAMSQAQKKFVVYVLCGGVGQ